MDVVKPITVTEAMLTSSTVLEPDTATGELAYSSTKIYAAGDNVASTVTHKTYRSLVGASALSIADPNGVFLINPSTQLVGWVAHGIAVGTAVQFTTTGALPTGITAGTTYYVITATSGSPADRFSLSATPGGAAISFGATQSGVHTIRYGSNLNKPLADETYWVEVGPTNRWKALDDAISTRAVRASSLQYVFTPGQVVVAVGVVGIVGSSVQLQVHNGATQVYTQTANLDSTTLGGWQTFLFGAGDNIREVVFILPPTAQGAGYKQTITINRSSGNAEVGKIILGSALYTIGKLTYGAQPGITSYTRDEENEFGTSEVVFRAPAKRLRGTIELTEVEADRVYRLLTDLESVSCLWIGVNSNTYAARTIIYGRFKEFDMQIAGPSHSTYALEIRGRI